MATSYTKENKPGQGGNSALTWNDMTETWNDVLGTWNSPRQVDATTFSKETKPTSSFTRETKP